MLTSEQTDHPCSRQIDSTRPLNLPLATVCVKLWLVLQLGLLPPRIKTTAKKPSAAFNLEGVNHEGGTAEGLAVSLAVPLTPFLLSAADGSG